MCKGEKRAVDYISVPFKMVIPAMEGRTQAVQETIGRLCPRPSIQSLSVGLQTVCSVTAVVPVLCGEQFTCLNLGF